MINDLSLILEPSVMLSSKSEEIDHAPELVSSHYGSDKTCQIVHGDLIEEVETEEKIIYKILDQDKLKQEWPFLRGMIQGSYTRLATEALCRILLPCTNRWQKHFVGELLPCTNRWYLNFLNFVE